MKFDRSKFTQKFVTEARDLTAFLSKAIVQLEQDPTNDAALPEIKRAAHTLKGSARMLKFKNVSAAAHRAEDLFIDLMDGKTAVSTEFIDHLLRLVEFMTRAVEDVGANRDEPAVPDGLLEGTPSATAPSTAFAVAAPAPSVEPSPDPSPTPKDEDTMRIPVADLARLLDDLGEARLDQRVIEVLTQEASSKGRRLLATIDGTSTLLHNQLIELTNHLQRLEERQYHAAGTVRSLFEQTERLRMVPLGDLFERFLVPVREAARSRGKRVVLDVTGGDMGLDKQIVDQLYGPMLHLLNNAVDHGIEAATVREQTGKPPTGRLTITARPLAGSVEITVTDDGHGVDTTRLVERAVERGIISQHGASTMTAHERLQLVFHPGLSSADIITDTSGRGVGMDVVKTVVEKDLKGAVTIATTPGVGTTTTLRLPLSLSSSRLFLVLCAGRTFAIPLSAVLTSLVADPASQIDIGGRRALRHENQFVPVATLASLLSLNQHAAVTSLPMLLLLVSGAERLALAVDEIVDEQEMLVRPLPPLIDGLLHVSGVTFGTAGDPIPVLYVPDLMESAHLRTEPIITGSSDVERRHYRVLVVDDSYNTREVQRHILESHGYVVFVAGDGEEALERLAREDVDLVVTDIEMPRMDGFTLVERIRSDEGLRRLPIIILTSRESEGDRARGVDVGANAYIVKRTFDEQKLTATLETLLP